jgi:16S rRNA (guanine966-N2)-methyltransferase
MRISGGTAKGRRTSPKRLLSKTFKNGRLRPTSSKVREALFDILREKINSATFIDLYAGTGTVGFEALSRGAKKVIFVEQNIFRVKQIKKSVTELGFQGQAEVVKGRASDFLMKDSANKELSDIFFLDPPYYSEEINIILPLIGTGEFLEENGVVIVEHFFKKVMPDKAGNLIIDRGYRYGDTMLTLYRRKKI